MRAIALILISAVLVGCAGRPAMVEVVCAVPPGTAVETSDGYAMPIGRHLRSIPDVAGVVTISTRTEVDAYVTGKPGIDQCKLAIVSRDGATAVEHQLAPHDIETTTLIFLPEDAVVPPVSTDRAEECDIAVDAQAAADAGVSLVEIDRALDGPDGIRNAPATEDGVEQLRELVVRNADGKRVHLGDIAAVSIKKTPVQVRRDF